MKPATGLLALAALSICAATAAAGPVVITFDDLVANGPNDRPAVFLNRQYASKGVTFNNVAVFDFSKPLPIPGFAHSGTNAIEQCVDGNPEFCTTPFTITFTTPQSRVKVWLGFDRGLTERRTVILNAFDASGSLVGAVSTTLNPSFYSQAVQIPLEFKSSAANITSAIVAAAGIAPTTGIAIDDLEFDTAGAPPPCLATQLPTVSLSLPASGDTFQVNSFVLQGSLTTGDPLATMKISIIDASGFRDISSATAVTGPFGPRTYVDVLSPGSNSVFVSVTDCRGIASAFVPVTYSPIATGAGFSLQGFEITQSIQNLDNTIPLIAGKRTFVRAYLRLTGSSVPLGNVTGAITACRPAFDRSSVCGDFLPNLQALNKITVDSSTDMTAKRGNLNATLNFELPADWTSKGFLHVQISHLDVGVMPLNLPCAGCDDPNPVFPVFPRYHEFQEGSPVSFLLHNVEYRQNGTAVNASAIDIQSLRSWIQRAYPTVNVVAPDNDFSAGFDSLPSCGSVNVQLFINKVATHIFNGLSKIFGGQVNDSSLYYGMVTDQGGVMRGCSSDSFKIDLGLTSITIHVGIGSGPTGNPKSTSYGWDTDASYGDWYGGHEIGHLYGRAHAPFGDACDGTPDPPFDWPSDAAHSGGSIGQFGFDVGDSSLSIPTQVFDPAIWHDVMTYRCNQWMSDYTYKGILGRLAPQVRLSAAPAPVIGDGLLVTGSVNLVSGAAQLAPFLRFPNVELTPAATNGQFSIDLLGPRGATLSHYPFDPAPSSDQTDEALIALVVGYVPGTSRIVLSKGSQMLASRAVSANAPSVAVVFPNGGETLSGQTATFQWQASDLDGDALTYTLLYSIDAGATWVAIATGLTQTSQVVNLATLPGSGRALFRVIASDGVNTAMADSHSTFHVPFKNPQPRIVSPADNSRYSTAQTIVFTGEAFDRQDGYLGGPSLQWTSDRQGSLGAGASISTALVPGLHLITLKATNSAGGQAQVSIHVNVLDVAAFDVPGDLNADGVVDCADLAIITASLGQTPGQQGFDARADVNHDGLADTRDLSFVQSRLPAGTNCATPLVIAKSTLADGRVGMPYTDTLVANGGVLPYRWSVTRGRLPANLVLNSTTGQITGIPTNAVTSGIVTFTVTDSSVPAQSASATIVITIR